MHSTALHGMGLGLGFMHSIALRSGIKITKMFIVETRCQR
jgi:hypothetical protein